MIFIVVVQHKTIATRGASFGPYRTFKQAEGDAKAWDVHPWDARVVPLLTAGTFDPKGEY